MIEEAATEAPIETAAPTEAPTQASTQQSTTETQTPSTEAPTQAPIQPPAQSKDDKLKFHHDVTPTHKLSKHNQYENNIDLGRLASDIEDASNHLSASDGLVCPIHKITESQKYANVINTQMLTNDIKPASEDKAINRKPFMMDPNTDRKHFMMNPSVTTNATAQGSEPTCFNPFITGLIAGASVVAAFALGLVFGARFK